MHIHRERIRQILSFLASRWKRETFLSGVALTLAVTVLLLLLSYSLHILLGIDAVSRFALIVIALSSGLTLLVHRVVLPLLRAPGPRGFAKMLDERIGTLASSLLPVLGLCEGEGNPRRPFSPELSGLAEAQVAGILEKEPRERLLQATGSGRPKRIAVLFLLLLLAVLLFRMVFQISVERGRAAFAEFLHPVQSLEEEAVWEFRVSPGDTSVLRGESPAVHLTLGAGFLAPVLRDPEPLIAWRTGSGKWSASPLVPEGKNTYLARLGPLDAECYYFLEIGKKRSPEYRIDVIDLPAVTRLTYSIRHPAYTGLPAEEVIDRGEEVDVLPGTFIALEGSSNNTLEGAWLVEESGERFPAACEGRSFRASFEVMNTKRFRLSLVDSLGNMGGDSLLREIRVTPDRHPAVRVLVPGQDVTVARDLSLPLVVRGEDDHGVAALDLVSWREADGESARSVLPIARPRPAEKLLQGSLTWDLSQGDAKPGDLIRYYVEATDNDLVSGPKKGRSETFAIKFPTMAEYLRERIEGEERLESRLEDVLAGAKDLSEVSEELEKRLRGAEEIDWEKRKEIEEFSKRSADLLEEIRGACTALEESVKGGEDIFSMEVLEKMMEVRNLLEKYATPEMREALARLDEALGSLSPSLIEQAMQKLRMHQDEFVKNLERTLTALRRLEIEQRLEAIEHGLEELGGRQERINEETERSSTEGLAGLSEEERRVSSELSLLAGEMEKARELLGSQGEEEAQAEMKDILGETNEDLSGALREAGEAMEGGKQSEALKAGREARKKFAELGQRVAGLTGRLRESWKEDTERVITRALSDLVTLSKKQGDLIGAIREHGTRFGPGVEQEIFREGDVIAGLETIAKYVDKATESSFFIGPLVLVNLGMSIMKGNDVAVELNRGEKAPGEVAAIAEESLLFTNRAAALLLADLDALQCSGSGSGLEQAFQEMAELAKMQAGLNQSTRDLLIPVPGAGLVRLTERERALLSELAAEEKRIAEGLERLGESTAGRRDVPGRLRELAAQADEIAREMRSQKLRPEILERQEKVLTRLLDAQRSMQERDSSKERKSQPGSELEGAPPLSLDETTLRGPSRATLMELMEKWRGTYPSRYEKAVYEYLREVLMSGEEGEQ
jgi:hypothetical protein